MRSYRIRLSDKTSRLHPRHVVPKPGQTYEPEVPVKVREWIGPALASPDLVLDAQPALIGRLNAAIVAALADPMVRERLAELGQQTFPPEQQSAAALGAWQKAEIDKWWPIVRAAHIKA